MPTMLLADNVNQLWYAVPLIISVSLVYAGTRHEAMTAIWWHAVRVATWIVVFMSIIFFVLYLMTLYV